MNSGNDLDMIDKVLFLIDKMFSENYGKTVKIIRAAPSLKEEYIYFEKVLRENHYDESKMELKACKITNAQKGKM